MMQRTVRARVFQTAYSCQLVSLMMLAMQPVTNLKANATMLSMMTYMTFVQPHVVRVSLAISRVLGLRRFTMAE